MTDSVTEREIVTFPEGLPGFETTRRFVLQKADGLEPFTLVRGLDDGAPAFVAIEPQRVDGDFRATIQPGDRLRLQARAGDALLWLALVTVQADGTVTVNLRAPIVVNPATMLGLQVVVADSPYALDHPLLAA
ncbi:MAG: flagellar assembly protein FliW [Vicinamibacterales bacterium]